jgi:hypothetical protein
LISSGSATLEIVAQVAAEEPETEPKMPQPRMVVCIRRPGTRLSQGRRPSNISSLSLVRNRISPIQMNRGRAASSQLALLSQKALKQVLARLCGGEKGLPDPAADGQRHCNPHAARKQQHHEQQQNAAHHQDIHVVVFMVWKIKRE